jgi:acyl-CoA oxidase
MKTKFSPQLSSLLPLFYIAWADSVLGPGEIALIEARLLDADWLSDEDKELVSLWSNPQNPPTEEQMAIWANAIRETAATLNPAAQISLAKLGVEMARTQTSDLSENWLSAEVVAALEDIEKALNLIGIEQHSELFGELQRHAAQKTRLENKGFNPQEMQALLDGKHAALRKKVFTLLQDPVFNQKTLRDKNLHREQVLEWLQLIANQGFGALHFPMESFGKNDMEAFATVFETLGYYDLSLTVKFGVQFGLFGGAVLHLGTEYHHKKYLKDIGTLALPGCFAMTETGHGSNVRDLETKATYDPKTDEIIIHSPTASAQKDYIGNAAAHGRMAVVFAQLIVADKNEGVHAILVPLRDEEGKSLPGIEIEDCDYKLGLNGVDNGRIRFHEVRVPRANLLNRYGNIDENGKYSSPIESEGRRFFTMLGTLVGGRVSVPRAGLSAAKTALTVAIRYALKRRQFGEAGQPEMLIMDYPSHQRRLMPLLAKAYAFHFALENLTTKYADAIGKDMQEVESLAAALKAQATWFASDAIQQCREACGGKGYLSETRFADLKADTDIFTTFEGDNTVLLQLVAKSLLQDFKKEMGAGGLFEILEFVAERFLTAAREKNPWAIRNTNESHLLSAEFQLHALRYRERDLLVSVVGRLRKHIGMGLASHHAFLRCQNHLLELAKAYSERVLMENFVAVIEKSENAKLKPLLERICSLYALHTIEQHSGWFLEQDYMDGAKTKAIRKVVDKLCAQLRDDAEGLVAAFGIPDDCLNVRV